MLTSTKKILLIAYAPAGSHYENLKLFNKVDCCCFENYLTTDLIMQGANSYKNMLYYSRPCLNGGTCVDAINSFHCTCVSGYGGDQCEKDIDECER